MTACFATARVYLVQSCLQKRLDENGVEDMEAVLVWEHKISKTETKDRDIQHSRSFTLICLVSLYRGDIL